MHSINPLVFDIRSGFLCSCENVLYSNAGTTDQSTPAVPRQKKQSRQELEFSLIGNVSGIIPANQDDKDSTELIYGSTLVDMNISSRLLALTLKDEDGDPYDDECSGSESDTESDSASDSEPESDSDSEKCSFTPDTINRFVQVFSLKNVVRA